MPLSPCTDKEWEELHHVIIASDMDWDPKVLDCEVKVDEEEFLMHNRHSMVVLLMNLSMKLEITVLDVLL